MKFTHAIKIKDQATHSQQHNFPSSTNPIKVQESNLNQFETRASRNFLKKSFQFLFYLNIFVITVLVTFFIVRGLLFSAHSNHFHPQKWFPPVLASMACASIFSFAWQSITSHNPSRTLRAAFWLSPLLTCAAGVLFVSIGSPGGLAIAVVAIVSAVIQSLYSCWVNPRFNYAAQVLLVSATPAPKTTILCSLSIIASTLYSCFLVSGIGGATASGSGLDTLFILIILLSLTWTMHIVKNSIQVTISRVKYTQFACGTDTETKLAFKETISNAIGSICFGSAIVPVLGVIRGSARATRLIAGDTDEFLFSCANCYSGVGSKLITYGNRWGFVHVGVYGKSFGQASADTWDMFRRVGLEPVIDSDLTSSFCFLSGMAIGSASALVGGSWALVVHKSYATEVSIYAFLIGYFISRVATSWQQACVSAYYVAYAENPQNQQFDATIPVRLEEVQRSQG